MEFSHVKYGVLVAMVAILFGGSLGLRLVVAKTT